MKSTYSPAFDSDSYPQKMVGYCLKAPDSWCETPQHHHRKGQLVMPLCGYVQVHINNTLWVVPNGSAIWIPGQAHHRCIFSSRAEAVVLFIDPSLVVLSNDGYTLSVTPLLRELMAHFSRQNPNYVPEGPMDRMVQVIVDELLVMPGTQLNFPLSVDPRLKAIAHKLLEVPGDRRTVAQWAAEMAMSESTLTRLVKQEINMSFGRWRGQLRLLMALQKLSVGEPVQRVSDSLGYDSVSAFITFFKNALGCSPTKYMQSLQ